MTNTIKINGLDVEFSEKVPTREGVYWWIEDAHDTSPMCRRIVMFREGLCDWRGSGSVAQLGGLWSAPLVPAVEVEKAFYEHSEMSSYTDGNIGPGELFVGSRAKRVTEGRQ